MTVSILPRLYFVVYNEPLADKKENEASWNKAESYDDEHADD